jgi:hypothetical protein
MLSFIPIANQRAFDQTMKATELYIDPTLILKRRVFADFGPPFDEQYTFHPVSVGRGVHPRNEHFYMMIYG